MKKELAINAQREEKVRRGELDPDKAKMGPRVVAIPNPEKTKVKVPTRLHEKIRESREPIVGLDFVKEWIAPSDPEMEPHYECQLCGSKVFYLYLKPHKNTLYDKKFCDWLNEESHNKSASLGIFHCVLIDKGCRSKSLYFQRIASILI